MFILNHFINFAELKNHLALILTTEMSHLVYISEIVATKLMFVAMLFVSSMFARQ
jgi:hypothetical protein